MSVVDPNVAFPRLELELRLLAAPGPFQHAWLMAEGVPIGELGEQFDDSMFVFAPGLIEDGLIGDRAAEALRAIEAQLETMSESGHWLIWISPTELRDGPDWQRMRDLAQAALAALGFTSSGCDVPGRGTARLDDQGAAPPDPEAGLAGRRAGALAGLD